MIKSYRIMLLAISGMCILIQSYPQSLLTNVHNFQNYEKRVVDKSIEEHTKYLDLDIRYPHVEDMPQKETINNEIDKIIYDKVKEVKDVIKDYYGDNQPAPLAPYQLYSRYQVTNRDKILSFYFDVYQFSGGAHGSTIRYAYNIDINTGNKLTIDDIFKDKNYKNIIDTEIKKQILKNKDYYFQGSEGFNGINKDSKFFLDKDNLTVYYQQYEIAPYSTGLPEFKIPLTMIN